MAGSNFSMQLASFVISWFILCLISGNVV